MGIELSLIYDAIIVGSGLGGLSCGAYLAKNGRKILLLEKNSVSGGYATSFEKGIFTFDATLHLLNGAGKGHNVYKLLEWCGVSESLEFLKLKYFGRIVFPEHDIRIPNGDLKEVMAVLENSFPHEKEGIKNLFKQMEKIYNDVFKFLYSSSPLWLQMAIFPLRYRSLYPAMKKTVKQILDIYLTDSKLKSILWANWIFYGLPPSKLNVFSVIGNLDYWMGSYLPKGGDQKLTDAFVNVIIRNQGKIILNSEVTSIIIENGKAKGVVTKKGEEFEGQIIISNANAVETFHDLVGEEKIPEKFIKKIDRMEPSMSAFVLYIGLDESFKALLDNTEDYLVMVNNTYDLDEDYQWHLDCEVEKASFIFGLSSNVDRSYAKGNNFVITLTQFQSYDYWKKYKEDYDAGNKTKYNEEKERIAKILVKRAEKVIPDLSKHIKVIEAATPLTLENITDNFNGAALGWANTPKQFTPMDRLNRIPIKNLYLSSAWTFPAGGQTAVIASGYRLARQLVGKNKLH